MKRRDFFKWLGAASGAALSACKVDKADEQLLPLLVPAEEGIVPGMSHFVRSTCMECAAHCGLEVKIIDGKAVKLEGSPDHPVNRGALCMRGQASLARLFHPRRIRRPLLKDGQGTFKPVSWDEAGEALTNAAKDAEERGLRNIFLSGQTNGTLARLIERFCSEKGFERCKEAEIFHHGAIKRANQKAFGVAAVPHFRIDAADVLVSLGADLFETFISPVEWARQYSEAKKRNGIRWFHVEPFPSLTGAATPDRSDCAPGSEPYLLAFLLHRLPKRNPLPTQIAAQVPDYSLDRAAELTGIKKEKVKAIELALAKAENPLIICGGAAAATHNGALAARCCALLQWTLGMAGKTVDFAHAYSGAHVGSGRDLLQLADDSKEGKIGAALFSRVHQLFALPEFTAVVNNCRFKACLAQVHSPFTGACDLVLPLADPLETWGDAEPRRGLVSLLQPASPPFHDSRSEGDIVLTLLGKKESFRQVLTEQGQGMGDEWLEKGYRIEETPDLPVRLRGDIELGQPGAPHRKNCLFVTPSLRTFDGRSSDIALLEEIPDPLNAVSYGKYVTISPPDAKKENLQTGDIAEIRAGAQTITLPVVVNPAFVGGVMTVAVDALSGLSLPVDRQGGDFSFCLEGVAWHKTGEKVRLPVLAGARTSGRRGILPQRHGEEHHGHHVKPAHRSLYPPHEHKEYRWGMAIDLDLCSGCSACAAACAVENNVPVVGRDEHLRGREMSWLRIESYYDDPGKPAFIPMMCQQCDNAPCETVCPVFATYHNPEGLNAQVYNRCVGTRYCANNCPYKVRRFNWFDNKDSLPLYGAANPELSVRPKGVMEKCSFCFQRIRAAKDRAKDEGRPVRDGEVVPACAQTCPSGAIVFGNLLDPDAAVSRLAKAAGSYRILEQLGSEPAVFYIKRDRSKMG